MADNNNKMDILDFGDGDVADSIIKVIGVGGGGGNAVNHMYREGIHDVTFVLCNTDAQALNDSPVPVHLQLGDEGLGAGNRPERARQAAEDTSEDIKNMLNDGTKMAFITAGMGGGTGTGAAPIVAQIAKELGILTVAVVTKPFSFEGKKRMMFAEMGIKELSKHVDSLIIIPNEQLAKVMPKNATLMQAFSAANDVLRNSVTGISDMITSPGLINVDFADVRTVMSEMGQAMIGFGSAKSAPGEGRAEDAAKIAVKSDLLERVDLSGAKGVLVNITAGMDLGLSEFYAVGDTVKAFASEEATVVIGTTLVPDMVDEIRVTIVATGIGEPDAPEIQISPRPQVVQNSQPGLQPVNTSFGGLGTRPQSYSQNSQDENHQQNVQNHRRDDLDTPITERLKDTNLFNVQGFMRNNDK